MITAEALNDLMQVDHVIKVKDGKVTDGIEWLHAPELMIGTDSDGQILPEHERHMRDDLTLAGWDVQTGWSGQYSYSGPIMHASEYIGEALADHIRNTDGYWVVIAAECWPVVGSDDSGNESVNAGWLLLHRELNSAHYVLTFGGWPSSGAVAHRIKDNQAPAYSGVNETACGAGSKSGNSPAVHCRTGGLIEITCKRGKCSE